MTISSKYSPRDIEEKWYNQWTENDLFHSVPDEREPYCIVIPPPNVTGVLHMGHMLNNTLQDVMTRRARLLGKNACWVPGTDHASIATEAKVVNMLKEQGLSKTEIGRDKFLEHAFEWKEKYGGIILSQLKKLGCSCDWERTRFTMEEKLSDAVISAFIRLYNDGYIYKGARMVNWDPMGKTALSDEEVVYEESNGNLYYVQYDIEGGGQITIATTRPETIMGDTAICVNPADERYKNLVGKLAIVPMVNRKVPVIADDYVDMEFGTGALKVTPAHDVNDQLLGEKHKLECIDIFNDDGTLNQKATLFVGLDRFVARKKAVELLKELGKIEKTETIRHKVGLSERTKAVIEPRISEQWFVNMKKFMTDNPEILNSVLNDEIKFFPAKYKNTYNHWLQNIKDWCISRQLWWGHRIPVWYLPNGKFVVAQNANDALAEARKTAPEISMNDLKQDEDVLDTWFSSWLWPIAVFDGFDNETEEFKYYYPTNDLVTGPDIIFFWVARMIMAGYHFKGKKPFNNVYFTGIVRDKQRRKMSKSLGNSPDPLELMENYGTDGVRLGLLLSAPAGNDILFDEALCEQGRNFCNKIWNAFRLLESLPAVDTDTEYYKQNYPAVKNWFEARFNEVLAEIDHNMETYRISDALMAIYKLTWDDFCSNYLEMIKPAYGESIPSKVLQDAKNKMESLMLLLHPFIPFITEELWQNLNKRNPKDFINMQQWPKPFENNSKSAVYLPALKLISAIRAMRNEKGISPKIAAGVCVVAEDMQSYTLMTGVIKKLANVNNLQFGIKAEGFSTLINTDEITVQFEGIEKKSVNTEQVHAEIERLEQFLQGIERKLSNEKFIANAQADVIAREKQKAEDTKTKINALKAELQ